MEKTKKTKKKTKKKQGHALRFGRLRIARITSVACQGANKR
jgi:hypothetical protein